MPFLVDLHVHSRHSRATSKDCDLEGLSWWGARKGLAVIGSGDITHPVWRARLEETLVPAEPGLWRLSPGLEAAVGSRLPAACRELPRFMLTGEIATLYRRDGRSRKIHHLVFLSDFAAAGRLAERLAPIGNLASDGRPMLGLDSRDLLEIVLETGTGSYLVPAHIWTPWYSVLGSRSGFDSIDACYRDLASEVFAAETGLSSDPAMNWRVSSLDRYRMVSNSDAHSPANLGREATVFDGAFDFFAIRRALETGQGYQGTVEFFPEEGKYHLDGHRQCGVRLTPTGTRAHGGRCPVCGGMLTVGVSHRVAELADRPEGPPPPPTAGAVRHQIPLAEVLAEVLGTHARSGKVLAALDEVTTRFGPELSVLATAPIGDLGAYSPRLARAILRLRLGEVARESGYDGKYGTIRLLAE